jgi:stearoyl-CoA desaturase (delta-9 desaturase)
MHLGELDIAIGRKKRDKADTGEPGGAGEQRPAVNQPDARARHERKSRRLAKRQQVKRSLYAHALANLTIPTAGCLAALGLAYKEGVGLMEVASLAVMYFLTAGAVSVAYHRHLAHRSFKAKPAVRSLLIIAACMAAQGPPIYWTAVHRHHHSHSDELEDSHSPYRFGRGTWNMTRGLWHAHAGWLLDHPLINFSFYVRDLLRDPLVRTIDRLYYWWVLAGLAMPAAVGWMVTGTAVGGLKGFLWGGLVRLFLVHHATWSVNSICHVFGKRPFPTSDGSANNALLAVPTVGESWHNNHHAFPYSAIFGLMPLELDLGGSFIRSLEACGLAWDVRAPNKEAIARKRAA